MREVRWQTMSTLAIKLLLAPIFIVFTYAIQKKYGPRIGGIFVAIPFIATPILLVIYFEHGSEFLHRAITGTYAGQAGVLFYIYIYTHLARSRSWPICFAAATTSYLILAPIFSAAISNIWVAIALWLVVWIFVQRTAPPFDNNATLPISPKWDLPMRIISALALIFLVTGFAQTLGPGLSGALAMYPVMTSIMSSCNHARFGADSAIAFLNGLSTYLVFVGVIFFPLLLIVT
jgi:hypothetical protein